MIARRFARPRPLTVETDAAGAPRSFIWRGRLERIGATEATWAEATGWWRGAGGATARRCYRVRAASGLRAVLYHHPDTDTWALGAIVD